MDAWLRQLFTWLPEGGLYYALIWLVALLESLVAAGFLVPGSTLIVFAGFLALHGKGEIVPLIAVAACGAFLGDVLSFWLGARLGFGLLRGRFMRKRLPLVRRAELFFVEHGGKSVFFGRFIGPIRGFIPFVAGSAQMPPRLFIGYAVISALLWGLAYPGLGYLAGASWQNVQLWSGRFALFIALLVALCLCWGWWRRRWK